MRWISLAKSRHNHAKGEAGSKNSLEMTEAAKLAALIYATSKGDRIAFKELYDRTGPKLFAVSLRIIRDRALAEDILQEVFLRIWQNAKSFSSVSGSPMAWLNAIARNRTIDVLRQKAHVRAAAESEQTGWYERILDPRDQEADIMNIGALRHCLAKIEEPARTCLLLAYYEGYSREQLAERYHKPVNTIKTWLHRSLTALKICLKDAV
jgi:RNA polymerase sigma factor (sigma-70 family)